MIDENAPTQAEPMDPIAPDWCGGMAPEIAAIVRAKGWHSPEDAIRSYMHLELLIGGDRLVVPTADSPAEIWHRLWQRLGRPETPDDYRFERPEGEFPYDEENAGWFRAVAHRLGLTGDQACGLHDAFIARSRGSGAESPEQDGDILEQLRAAWGGRFPARMAEARRGLNAGIAEDAELHAIGERIGDVALMNLLAGIGRSLGEDNLVGGRGAGELGIPDPRSEIRRVQAEAHRDPRHPYLDKTHPEHDSAVRRMQSLFERAYGN